MKRRTWTLIGVVLAVMLLLYWLYMAVDMDAWIGTFHFASSSKEITPCNS